MRGRKGVMFPIRERYFFECFGCSDTSEAVLQELFDKIVEKSGMKLLAPPQSVKADDGISIQGIWEASTLAIHGWDAPRLVTIDIYSCRHINALEMANTINEILNPKTITFSAIMPNDMVVILRRE